MGRSIGKTLGAGAAVAIEAAPRTAPLPWSTSATAAFFFFFSESSFITLLTYLGSLMLGGQTEGWGCLAD